MAREWALAGVDRSELTPPPPPEQPKTLSDKWKNFWYHHKPFIILGAIFLAIGLLLLVQILTANPDDYSVVVVTKDPLIPTEIDALEAYLAACGVDLDGDGRVEVNVKNLTPTYYDEFAPGVGAADNDQLQAQLASGDVMLFVFDKASYQGFTDTIDDVTSEGYTFFAPVETTNANYDAAQHYWNWNGDARIAQSGLAGLPEDLYFGVRQPSGMASGNKSVALYEDGLVLIKNLIDTAKQ